MNRILLRNNSVITFDERPGLEFNIDKLIGKGSSCVVYHTVCSDNTEHLLKEYYPKHLEIERNADARISVTEKDKDAFEQGLRRFQSGCEHQKAIRLSNEDLKNFTCNVQGYYKANGTEYIDMTCFNGQTYDKVQEKSVYDMALRMRTLAQVVGNYHKAKLLHLDIKPENIYVRPANETVEDVMLFDFDSVVAMDDVRTSKALSCTKTWAAPEQLLANKRGSICPATDLFAIGEIIFVQLFNRHSTQAERRSFVKKYEYDYEADIFKDVNPKVFALLDELLSHTICSVVSKRYQSAEELIAKLDEIIKIADPKEPYLKSSLPAVQNFFVGREDEIEEIHEKLRENNVLFLKGIGGIGKSELAKQYARAYKKEYDVIIFAPYLNNTKMLIQNDVSIPLFNFHEYPGETSDKYYERKFHKLQELCDERTLFIVDNLDSDEDENITKLFDLQCKVLVTTRMDFSDYGYGQQLNLDAIKNRKEVRSIFNKYYTKALTNEEDACVDDIIDLIAGHTMTVELLAKQMIAGRVTPNKMLAKLKEGGISESGKEKVRIGKDGILAAQSAYAHIQTLFDLSELEEKEKYVLTNLSLIPHTGILTELFYDWCELEDYEAINRLVIEGWIRLEEEKDYISLHPVVNDIIEVAFYDTLYENNLIYNFSVYVSNESDDYHKHVFGEETRMIVRTLLYHISDLIMRRGEFSGKISDALYSFGGVFLDYYDYSNCEKVWEKVCDDYCNRKDPKYIAEIQCSLALLYAEVGKVSQNEAKILESISIYESMIPVFEESGDIASLGALYNNIGSAYHDLKKYELAILMYNKSIETHRKQSEKGNNYVSHMAICYNNIGAVYKDKQQYDYAKVNYIKALDLLESLTWSNIDNALVRHNLAVVLLMEDNIECNLENAKKKAEEALSIRRELYAEGSIQIAQTKELLARILIKFNSDEFNLRSQKLLIDAREPFMKYFGEKHIETQRLLETLELVNERMRLIDKRE